MGCHELLPHRRQAAHKERPMQRKDLRDKVFDLPGNLSTAASPRGQTPHAFLHFIPWCLCGIRKHLRRQHCTDHQHIVACCLWPLKRCCMKEVATPQASGAYCENYKTQRSFVRGGRRALRRCTPYRPNGRRHRGAPQRHIGPPWLRAYHRMCQTILARRGSAYCLQSSLASPPQVVRAILGPPRNTPP